jgi:hypothetical protein
MGTGAGGGGGRGGGRAGFPGAAPDPTEAVLITGSDGRFLFRDLPPGSYPIQAQAAGYMNGSAGQARIGGPIRIPTLAAGRHLTDVRIRLWKHAVVSGRVVDEAGEPVVGLTVRAVRRTVMGAVQQFGTSSTARTDDRGIYRIATLAPGEYLISVPQTHVTMPAAIMERMSQAMLGGSTAPPMEMIEMLSSGLAAAAAGARVGDLLWASNQPGAPVPPAEGRFGVYATTFYPAATTTAEAPSVELRSGEERSGVDMQLRLVPAVRVSGTVIGPDGPAAHVAVRLVSADLADTSGSAEFDAAASGTRADGTFSLIGVPPGRYVATVMKRGSSDPMMQAMRQAAAMTGNTMPAPASAPSPPLYGRAQVTVGGSDVSGVQIVMREGVKVSGRVEFDGTSPKPTPQELGGGALTVRMTPADGRINSMMINPSPVDQSGVFSITGLLPGRYTLFAGRIGGPGSAASWQPSVAMYDGRNVLTEPFEIGDKDISELVISFTDRPTVLTGSVTTGATPSGTATVVIFPADVRRWIGLGMPSARARNVAASTTGAFTINGLEPGEYLLVAVDDAEAGELQDPKFIQAVAPLATRVTLAAGNNKMSLRLVKVPK